MCVIGAPPAAWQGPQINRNPANQRLDKLCALARSTRPPHNITSRPLQAHTWIGKYYLWLMLALPLLPALYLWLLRWRGKPALRLASVSIARKASSRQWRRHVPSGTLRVGTVHPDAEPGASDGTGTAALGKVHDHAGDRRVTEHARQ
jgi:hypothetical protein